MAPAGVPSSLMMAGSMPKNGSVADPGLVVVAPGRGVIRMPPVSVCHQVSTMGHFSWPMLLWYHIQASGLIGSPTVPSSLSEERSVPVGPLLALPHQRADGGGGGVEDVDLELLHDLPEPVQLRIGGYALEHDRGGAVGQRSVDDVAVPGDPADVGGAPVDVLVPESKMYLVVMVV